MMKHKLCIYQLTRLKYIDNLSTVELYTSIDIEGNKSFV
jgi:hypothetical protein